MLCVKAGAQLAATKQFVDQCESFNFNLVMRLDKYRAQIEHNGEKNLGLGGVDPRHDKMVAKRGGKAAKAGRGERLVNREIDTTADGQAGSL